MQWAQQTQLPPAGPERVALGTKINQVEEWWIKCLESWECQKENCCAQAQSVQSALPHSMRRKGKQQQCGTLHVICLLWEFSSAFDVRVTYYVEFLTEVLFYRFQLKLFRSKLFNLIPYTGGQFVLKSIWVIFKCTKSERDKINTRHQPCVDKDEWRGNKDIPPIDLLTVKVWLLARHITSSNLNSINLQLPTCINA